mmetsp:Transcript_19507/g.45379  ORF Transcript_19507/g.45379 Transcript_19507/m.45379 type:complete len:231 (-) Transcript_19507:93-785(-)|eukprot:CAMPEP_0178451132 /NCGR_PEP_ID=MMETSP0689_2-20121128/43509_1 /TAXON_ID=160604 /ORGANISM="Amphidinium massartii, Strain CS-259" /LENGTH=230 /DNA_ID=CAMNT_0020076673 /DNA_START=118 /DNA_END=810 /DNA_ORIENTATION=-
MEEERVRIPVGTGQVSALVTLQAASPVVVIATHPWGPLGGSMHDPHPTTACRLLAAAGCSTCRFNFRSGIGRGNGSVEDVKAVAEWFVSGKAGGRTPLASQVLLIGYSYGSMIAAAAAAEIQESIGYALYGPPLDYAWAIYCFNGGGLKAQAVDSAGKPKLLVCGDDDQFCSVRSFQAFVEELPEPKRAHLLQGVTHFDLYGHMRKTLTDWLRDAFQVPDLPAFAKGAGK